MKMDGWWGRALGKPRRTVSLYTSVRLKRHHAKARGHYIRNEQGINVWYSPGTYIQVQKLNKKGKWLTFKKKFKSEDAAVDFLVLVVKKMEVRQRFNGSLD